MCPSTEWVKDELGNTKNIPIKRVKLVYFLPSGHIVQLDRIA